MSPMTGPRGTSRRIAPLRVRRNSIPRWSIRVLTRSQCEPGQRQSGQQAPHLPQCERKSRIPRTGSYCAPRMVLAQPTGPAKTTASARAGAIQGRFHRAVLPSRRRASHPSRRVGRRSVSRHAPAPAPTAALACCHFRFAKSCGARSARRYQRLAAATTAAAAIAKRPSRPQRGRRIGVLDGGDVAGVGIRPQLLQPSNATSASATAARSAVPPSAACTSSGRRCTVKRPLVATKASIIRQ